MDENLQTIGCVWGIVFIVFLVVMIFTGGIYRTEVTYTFLSGGDVTSHTTFEENFTARHWLAGLVKGKQPDLQEALAKYVRQGEQIAQLTVITKHTVVTFLLSGITLGIYCPQTVTVRGTIHRVQKTTTE